MTELQPSPQTPPSLMPPFWLMGILLLLCGAVLVWRIPPLLRSIEERQRLGSEALITNGFDLPETLRSDPTLVRWGSPEEVIPIDTPPIWGVEKVDELGTNFRTRFLISTSEVIGVVIDGQPRAYPLRILQWHEVVNDTLGEIPICVIYHPLSETSTVFQRPQGNQREPLIFGSSGLLVDCCLLIHERLGIGRRLEESLWSPTDGEVIAGPRIGEPLKLVPFMLTSWKIWKEKHPDTEVLGMVERHRRYYKKEPYSPYRLVDRPRYQYLPQPPAGQRANLSRVIVTRQPLGWMAQVSTLGGADPHLDPHRDRLLDPAPFPHVVTSWFAIHARQLKQQTP
ncbi:MAG: DUF3179 domain-containing (seleno)protein [Planctomycetota bacterium]|nr:DUF3179 domain-containing (seleno)protein [Planctomycetota bacterium]